MRRRLPVLAALLCLAVSGCETTVAGTAAPVGGPGATGGSLVNIEALPGLLLGGSDVNAAMSANGMVVTRDVNTTWDDSAHIADKNCLAVSGAAQEAVYAGSGWTATRSQVLREPPGPDVWAHYVTQAVVVFPTATAAATFFTASMDSWANCSNRQLTYPAQFGPDQIWSIGASTVSADVLAISKIQDGPQRWGCQRALTVRSNVAIDIEACSLDQTNTGATAIAHQISARLPGA
jgi:PknH-like extracellular domain